MAAKKINAIRRKIYLESNGTICPFCGGRDLFKEWADIQLRVKVSCENCSKRWIDINRVVDIEYPTIGG